MSELTCPVCGIAWTRHLGMIGTCDRVKRLEAQRLRLARMLARANSYIAYDHECKCIDNGWNDEEAISKARQFTASVMSRASKGIK